MSHYFTFLIVSFIIIVTPGPDFALVIKNTILKDSKGGRATAYGIVTGHIVHTITFILGISALIANSLILFQIVKYIGAAYLFYLGIRAIFSKSNNENMIETKSEPRISNVQKKTQTNGSCYLQGLMSTVINPKAIIFYITFLPQFININENVLLQTTILSSFFITLVLFWFLLCVFILKYIRKFLIKSKVKQILEKVTGIIFISLGLKLVTNRS